MLRSAQRLTATLMYPSGKPAALDNRHAEGSKITVSTVPPNTLIVSCPSESRSLRNRRITSCVVGQRQNGSTQPISWRPASLRDKRFVELFGASLAVTGNLDRIA
jgi:hypothetical protein